MSYFDQFKNVINQKYMDVVKTVKAPPKTDQFKETGMLSPDEYVRAGDKLIQVSPEWSWQKAPNANNTSQYLPKDKQCLLLSDCPSYKRCKDIMRKAQQVVETELDDGWVMQRDKEKNNEEVSNQMNKLKIEGSHFGEQNPDEKENEQKEEEKEQEQYMKVVQQDEQEEDTEESETRIYSIYITYDEYYYCPRLFLTAVVSSEDENDGKPVEPEKIFDDIAAEKINTTVTIEKHPILQQDMATIHPCKHSHVLKVFADQIREGRSEDAVGSHMAIILFLKFFHDVIPTLSFDSNFDIDFGA